jgi:hypothetical protein
MLGTNGQFESMLRQVDSQIGTMERALTQGGEQPSRLASALEELWAKRRALKLLLLNRKVEAAKKIVDLQRWRDGNGALYLAQAPSAAKQRARA